MKTTRRTTIAALATAALVLGMPAAADAAEKLRISLDTNENHVRNKGVELFVEALKTRVGDDFEIEVYPSAQLYRDRDVGRALRQESVEMAVPGTWVLDGMVPSMAMTSLPAFYGLSEDVTLDLMDGTLGEAINQSAEDRMRVHVLGPWMNLGFSHFYSTDTPLNRHKDLEGLRVRISGGTANAVRVEGLGATPNVIAWPDVPQALSSDVVDAISSTHESINSAKLWDSGLRYAFEDNQWFGQYVPMVSAQFWERQSEENKMAMTEAWAESIHEARRMAADAQAEARQNLIDQGIEIAAATEEELARSRAELMSYQEGLLSKMDIDQELVDLAIEELTRRGLLE